MVRVRVRVRVRGRVRARVSRVEALPRELEHRLLARARELAAVRERGLQLCSVGGDEALLVGGDRAGLERAVER